jgi:coenzyme F420 hydrogenase subunit delta
MSTRSDDAAYADEHGLGSPPWAGARSIVLGCGNRLLGDDGFGPAVANYILEKRPVPNGVCVLDAGTSVRNILFDLIAGDKPERIVIVDVIDRGRKPGEVFEVPLDDLGPVLRSDDYASHLGPTSNLLFGLRNQRGIDVKIVACQLAQATDELGTPITATVAGAIPEAAALALRLASSER